MTEKRKRYSDTNYNRQVSNMMNRLNDDIKVAGGLNKYINGLKNERAEKQRRVMRIMANQGTLTPAVSRMLTTPVTVNSYIQGQKNNKDFINAISRVYRSGNKNKISRENLARYLRMTLKNININKLYPYSGYYNKNGNPTSEYNNYYNGLGPYNSQPNDPPTNAIGEYGKNYTNFQKLQKRTSFMNLNKNKMFKLVDVYVNHRRGYNNLARNTLQSFFRNI